VNKEEEWTEEKIKELMERAGIKKSSKEKIIETLSDEDFWKFTAGLLFIISSFIALGTTVLNFFSKKKKKEEELYL